MILFDKDSDAGGGLPDSPSDPPPQPKPADRDLSSDVVQDRHTRRIRDLENKNALLEDTIAKLTKQVEAFEEKFNLLRGVKSKSGRSLLDELEELFKE